MARFGSFQLVHESACADPLKTRQHRSFVVSRLLGGAAALVVLFLYSIVVGFNFTAFVVLLWLALPIFIAVYLSLTGHFVTAHFLSSVNLAGIVSFVMGLTGGITSVFAPWMLLVPVEGALSGDRRAVGFSIAVTVVSLIAVYLLIPVEAADQWQVASSQNELLAFVAILSACAYGAGLAFKIDGEGRARQARLRVSEAKYRLLGENASDLITLHNEFGEVVYASPSGTELFGVGSASLCGAGLFDHVDPVDREMVTRTLRVASREAHVVRTCFRVRAADDGSAETRWAEMRCRAVTQAQSGWLPVTSGVVAVTRDITAQQNSEVTLSKALEEAQSADRMKSDFLANVGHEFKTPLNSVIGFSRMLERELGRRSDLHTLADFASQVRNGGELLLSHVNDILTVAQIEGGRYQIEKQPLVVSEIVSDVVRSLSSDFDQASVRVDADAALLPALFADERACREILSVVIKNAVKFSPEGGIVYVRPYVQGSDFVIEVSDSGDGVPPEKIRLLGTAFYRGDFATGDYRREHGGLGLGLAKVNGLMHLHGGRMYIESVVGEGTCVKLRFPQTGERLTNRVDRQMAERESHANKGRSAA